MWTCDLDIQSDQITELFLNENAGQKHSFSTFRYIQGNMLPLLLMVTILQPRRESKIGLGWNWYCGEDVVDF